MKRTNWSAVINSIDEHSPNISKALRAGGFYALTDEGAAYRAVEIAVNRVRVARDSGRAFAYDATTGIWIPDADECFRIAQEVKNTIREEQRVVVFNLTQKAYKSVVRMVDDAYETFLNAMETRGRIRAVADLLSKMPDIQCRESDFDNDLDALNCGNGWVDLRTGKLHPHFPGKLFTKTTGLDYVEGAECPRWNQHFEECFPRNPKVRAFLLRSAGAALSGRLSERAMPFLYGKTAAGKSVMLDAIAHVMGDYAVTLPPTVLMRNRGSDNARDDARARLQGARFVVADEIPGGVFDEATVKTLASLGKMTARRLYGHAFDFPPQHTVFIASNEKPIIDDSSGAVWDRIRFVEFKESFKDRKEFGIEDKFRHEATGILAQLVRDCREWYKSGMVIPVPSSILAAGKAYSDSMDIIKQFKADAFIEKEGGFLLKGMAFEAFKEYARRENQWRSMTARRFHGMMDAAGFPVRQKRDKNGKMSSKGYFGLTLNGDYEDATHKARMRFNND